MTEERYYEDQQIHAGKLLRYYQQTAQELNQVERANALNIQHTAYCDRSLVRLVSHVQNIR